MTFRDFLFLVLALVLVLVAFSPALIGRRKKEPLELPIVSATVEEVSSCEEEVCSDEEEACSDESEGPGNCPPKYTGGIIYSYKVGGETYSGLHDFPELHDSPEAAEEQVKHWIGRRIQVQYDPGNPQVSFFLDE